VTITSTTRGLPDQTLAVNVVVAQPVTFTISLSPVSLSLPRGGNGAATVNVSRIGGVTGSVTVAAAPRAGLPATVISQPGAGTTTRMAGAGGAPPALGSYSVPYVARAGGGAPQATTLTVTVTTSAVPPFGGTIFVDPDIITPADPTTFTGLTYAGQGSRLMFDRRFGWVTLNAFLFNAVFDDGLTAEVQVNPEFGTPAASQAHAELYAAAIGRLPTALRQEMRTVWIHQGVEPFGGGNNNILIHVGQADQYVASGILEETLVHEASHTSLDATHATSAGWLAAQAADGTFISTYARDFPTQEDIAESFLLWLALRHRPDRISDALKATIQATMPARLAYFDGLALAMHPIP
jgi:hypothetical protein